MSQVYRYQLLYAVLLTFVFVPIFFWCNWCNCKTADQRHELISKASVVVNETIDDPAWKRFYEPLKQVSYGSHLWYLITFRDPMILYQKCSLDELTKSIYRSSN